MTTRTNTKETRNIKKTDKARQGERRKGMPSVLAISTVLAVILVFGAFMLFAR